MNKERITLYLISAMGLGGILYYIANRSKSDSEDERGDDL